MPDDKLTSWGIEHSAILERFFAKVRKLENGCWEWTGSRTRPRSDMGYGSCWVDGRLMTAHRVSYMLYVGTVPEGRELDHLCRFRPCVNPEHLEPVTRRENVLRGEHPTAVAIRAGKCINGHEKTYEGRCSICYEKWRIASQAKNRERRKVYMAVWRSGNRPHINQYKRMRREKGLVP